MLPLHLLTPVNDTTAPQGSILLSSRDNPKRVPSLVVGGQVPMILPLGGDPRGAFRMTGVSNKIHLSLALSSWRVLVEETDLVSPFADTPSPGEMFFSGGVAGIIGIQNHTTAYVDLQGNILPEPNWADYIGFRRWKIVADVDNCCNTHVVFDSEKGLAAD